MTQIKPMLLEETEDKELLEDDTKWYQIKENGVRALVHVKDSKIVGIRNRSNNPILYCFPEFKDLDIGFNEAILDCEIIVFKKGKSVFYGGIDNRRSVPSEKVLKENPATIVVFDALKIGSEILVTKPYKYRYERIKQIEEQPLIQVIRNYMDGKSLWAEVERLNLEGVVIKDPNSMYELGKRSRNYLKLKYYKFTEVTVEKTEPNSRGTKIYGKAKINNKEIEVECQLGGVYDVSVGEVKRVRYLDIIGNRLIQPTKFTG